jgi:hypothetical protein
MLATDHIPLGAVLYEAGFDIDRVLWMVVDKLREGGAVVAGVIQTSAAPSDGCCAHMNLVDLKSNRVFEISQELGPQAQGCNLDQRGLAEAAGIISEAITADIDFLVINRFGKAESEGVGLASCISDAIGAGIPVLTAVREPYIAEWQAFHGGLATDLSPSAKVVIEWCAAMVPPRLASRMVG